MEDGGTMRTHCAFLCVFVAKKITKKAREIAAETAVSFFLRGPRTAEKCRKAPAKVEFAQKKHNKNLDTVLSPH